MERPDAEHITLGEKAYVRNLKHQIKELFELKKQRRGFHEAWTSLGELSYASAGYTHDDRLLCIALSQLEQEGEIVLPEKVRQYVVEKIGD